MAGEWLKMESSTPDKPEVFAITAKMGWDDPDLTVGKLFRVWRWFDQQTVNGNAVGVTYALLDRIAGATGFAQAMIEVAWLAMSENGLSLPNFEKHNGATAKGRAQTAKRVANYRADAPSNANSNAPNVTEALAREEKRREEKNKENKKQNKKPPAVPTFDPIPALAMLGVGEQTVADWIALRKTKRAVVTKTVVDNLLREAAKAGMDLDSVLSVCCSRGWVGFEAAWVQRDASSHPPGRFDPTAHVNRNRPRPQ
jgi:hypothetical protein